MSLLLLSFYGCRSKETVVGPSDSTSGHWHIALDTSATLFIPNDTLYVRLFDPNGVLAVGKLLNFAAEVDTNHVTSVATTWDTTVYWWGANPAVIYFGTGGNDQDNPHDVIDAYYIDLQSHDTLAHTSRAYRVLPRP